MDRSYEDDSQICNFHGYVGEFLLKSQKGSSVSPPLDDYFKSKPVKGSVLQKFSVPKVEDVVLPSGLNTGGKTTNYYLVGQNIIELDFEKAAGIVFERDYPKIYHFDGSNEDALGITFVPDCHLPWYPEIVSTDSTAREVDYHQNYIILNY